MMWKKLFAAGLLIAGTAANASDDVVTVTDFVREQVGIYDVNRVLIKKVPQKELQGSVKGAKVRGHEEEDGRVRINFEGKEVWLRSSDVVTTGGRPKCAAVAQAQRSANERIAASSIGVVAGMGSSSAACVTAQ